MKNRTLAILALPFVVAYILLTGMVSRMLGGGVINLPNLADRILFGVLAALPFPVLGFVLQGDALYQWWVPAGVLAVAAATCNMGHADFFYGWKGERDQRASPAVAWLFKKIFDDEVDRQDWRYDAIGMALVGLAATVPTGIGFIVAGHIGTGIVVALSGASKAYAYKDGLLTDPAARRDFTTRGEWRRGWFAGAAFALGTAFVVFWEKFL